MQILSLRSLVLCLVLSYAGAAEQHHHDHIKHREVKGGKAALSSLSDGTSVSDGSSTAAHKADTAHATPTAATLERTHPAASKTTSATETSATATFIATKTFQFDDLPEQVIAGQSGVNNCDDTKPSSQSSQCQNSVLNSLDDFCLFAPPEPNSNIGDTERVEVSWCLKSGYGTRMIPEGAITGAHFVITPDYVQVTGVGNLELLNIAKGDGGGELDPHGADKRGNPVGGLVFSDAFGGGFEQTHEWTQFIGNSTFCFRACKDGPKAANLCQHIYDEMGCSWNMPANYNTGFESCKGDTVDPPQGIYVDGTTTSTFKQGDAITPAAHPAPSSSECSAVASLPTSVATSKRKVKRRF